MPRTVLGVTPFRSSSWPEKRLPRGLWHGEPLEISLATPHITMALSCNCTLPHWRDAEARWSEGNAFKGLGSLQAAHPGQQMPRSGSRPEGGTEPLLNGRNKYCEWDFHFGVFIPYILINRKQSRCQVNAATLCSGRVRVTNTCWERFNSIGASLLIQVTVKKLNVNER